MIKTIDKLKQYILTMLGSPVVAVDLSDEELDFCVDKPLAILREGKLDMQLNPFLLDRMVRKASLALARYTVAKKRFNCTITGGVLKIGTFTPDEDGFSEMAAADLDWSDFMDEVNLFRRSLRYTLEQEE